MKKIFYLMMVAVMAISMTACNLSNQSKTVEPEPTYMEWQMVDSTTSHVNLSDTACVTVTSADGILMFTVNGVESFKVLSDGVELPVEQDSNTYRLCHEDIPAGYPVTIHADSVEIDLDVYDTPEEESDAEN